MNGRRQSHGFRAAVSIIGCVLLLLAASTGLQAQSDPYQRGTRALDRHEWEDAAEAFAEAARAKGDKADAALYWRAYSLGKLERVGIALGSLEKLADLFPESRWLDDAEELRAELTGSASVQDEKEELRLMALFSLTQSNPARAVAYLEKFLQGDNSLGGKEQALFLAMQTGSTEALDLVASIAKGESEPELQSSAVHAMGMLGSSASEEILSEIYRDTDDRGVKRAVLDAYLVSGSTRRVAELARDRSDPEMRRAALEMLGMMGEVDVLAELYAGEKDLKTRQSMMQGFMVAGASDRLLEIAKNENEPELRHEAIQYLGMTGAQDALWELYQNESSLGTRSAIVRGMSIGGGGRYLTQIVKSDADPALRAEAIQGLGIAGVPSAEFLVEIYKNEREPQLKHAAIQALFMADKVDALLAIARDEDSPALKREIVQMLAMTGSEKATEYLMELLDE